MKKFSFLLVLGVIALFMSSCQSYRHSMREPANHVEFYADDFELSEPVTGEATITRVLGVDWEHTFGTTTTGIVNNNYELPIIGTLLSNTGANYAIYDLLQKNPGYDVIFFPQVEVHRSAPILGTDFFSTTTYKVTARLGKMKQK